MNKRQLIAWITAGYVTLLTVLCLVKLSVPAPDMSRMGFDKIVHFCFYVVLNTLLVSTIIACKAKATTTQIVATSFASITYGVAIEFIQKEVGRDFDIYDIVANSIGVIIAATAISMPQIKSLLTKYLIVGSKI